MGNTHTDNDKQGCWGVGGQKLSWGRIGYRLIGLAEGFLESDLGKIVLRERYLIYRLGNGMGYISTCYIICTYVVRLSHLSYQLSQDVMYTRCRPEVTYFLRRGIIQKKKSKSHKYRLFAHWV